MLSPAFLTLATIFFTTAQAFTGDGTSYSLSSASDGNCNMMTSWSQASTYYAAINSDQWDEMNNCGRCAQVWCADSRCTGANSSVTVQILDRCPECVYGDLDLGEEVFTEVTGSTPDRYTIAWEFVDCPVSGNLQYCAKTGSSDYWLAVQPGNMKVGVSDMTINDNAATKLDGAYYYLASGSVDLSSVKISVTSAVGEVVEDTVSLTADACTDGNYQFTQSDGSSDTTTTTSSTTSSTTSDTTPASTTTTPTTTTSAPTTATTSTPTTTTSTPTTTESATVPSTTTSTPTTTTSTPTTTTSTPTTTTSTPTTTTSTPASTKKNSCNK